MSDIDIAILHAIMKGEGRASLICERSTCVT